MRARSRMSVTRSKIARRDGPRPAPASAPGRDPTAAGPRLRRLAPMPQSCHSARRPARVRPRARLASLHLDDRPGADPAGDGCHGSPPRAVRRTACGGRHVVVVVGDPRLPPPRTRRRAASPGRRVRPRDVRRAHPRAGGPAGRAARLDHPAGLDHVFFADSGSVSVEVALKMALQHQRGVGRPERTRMLTVRGGYHGDTFGAMSVCDPVGGMHTMFTGVLQQQVFADRPPASAADVPAWAEGFRALAAAHAHELAGDHRRAGAPGRRRHARLRPACVRVMREVADEHGLVLVLDEIATGFGRTGTLFAAEAAGISPDVMCVGKALTGGYLTLAAVLCTSDGRARAVARRSPACSCTARPTWATRWPARSRWPTSTCSSRSTGAPTSPASATGPGAPGSSRAVAAQASPTSARSAPSASSSSTTGRRRQGHRGRARRRASGCGRSATSSTRCLPTSAPTTTSRRICAAVEAAAVVG